MQLVEGLIEVQIKLDNCDFVFDSSGRPVCNDCWKPLSGAITGTDRGRGYIERLCPNCHNPKAQIRKFIAHARNKTSRRRNKS